MTPKSIEETLRDVPFFRDFSPAHLAVLAGAARRESVAKGSQILFIGETADRFYAILAGRVDIEIVSIGSRSVPIETLNDGDVLGWSWLVPPHHWHFDAVASRDTELIVFDGAALRARCDADPDFGYAFTKRFLGVTVRRLQAARLRLLDAGANLGLIYSLTTGGA